MKTNLSRRQLFRLRFQDLRRLAAPAGPRPERRFSRPPGALEEEPFQAACERCHACVEACPHDALTAMGPSFGALEGTPSLRQDTHPCLWCPSMPCIASCPTGALTREEAQPVPAVATVELDLEDCLTSQGILCDTCSLVCPPEVRAIRMVSRSPVVDAEACVGCGLCVIHCESPAAPLKLKLPRSAP